MVARSAIAALAVAAIVSTPIAAKATDPELTYGGTPRLLNGNTTVSMKSEYVKVEVGDKYVTVDCRFTFVNNGPARKVRMGFPDEGGEPGVSLDPQTGKPIPPVPSIESFKSWVNGKLVKTTAIPAGDDSGSFWHVKRVDFPANRTLEVRDRYTVEVGSSVAYSPISVHMAKYILHTGSSWHGNIGRSEVEVVFTRKGVQTPIAVKRLPDDHKVFVKNASTSKRTVYYRGPCKPTVSGNRLRFLRTNWRPAKKDDVFLVFDMSRMKATQ
jgi:hypothetical protein